MEKHGKKLARTTIISSIVTIIAIVTWLVKGVGVFALSANKVQENAERIKETTPIINKVCSDIEVIKTDTAWIKEFLKSK